MQVNAKYNIKKITTQVVSTLGAIAAVISIYVFFFQEKEVRLQYEIITNTNVLDIKADVSKLDISYNGKSLKNKNDHLRIISIRIINRGSEKILKEYFDDNDPVGFRISQGKIIEKPELTEASSQYLKDNLEVSIDASGRVKFSKIILEPKEYFILKLLILHKSNAFPKINATGKIAGMKEVQVIDSFESEDQKPFFTQVFSGALLVQMVRAIVYFLIVLIIILIIAFSIEKITDIYNKHKRKLIVEEFINTKKYNYSKMDDAIFDCYIDEGLHQLKNIHDLLEDEKELNRNYNESVEYFKKNEKLNTKNNTLENTILNSLSYTDENIFMSVNKMLEDGLVIREKNKLIINQPMKSTLDSFFTFLKQKNKFDL